jgi:predicted trehalose synthase
MAAVGAGNSRVRVGNESIPVEAFFTMLETLARDAGAEYRAIEAEQSMQGESYLAGESIDPAVPEERAYALFEALREEMDQEYQEAEDEAEELELFYDVFDQQAYDEESLLDVIEASFVESDVEDWIG